MRLSDVLSKPPKDNYIQIEGFLQNKKGTVGQKVDLSVGEVMLNYYCAHCEDLRTFSSRGKLSCIFVNTRIISIDCVLTCGCGASVQVWFLVESSGEITSQNPQVRIIRRSERLPDTVKINFTRYGEFSILLDKAEQAYREELGAGAIVYLRKVFEKITIQTANAIVLNMRNMREEIQKTFRICSKKLMNSAILSLKNSPRMDTSFFVN